jgi:agmatinase
MHTVFWPPASTNWLPGLVESLTDTVYVSIDADVFDSGFLPGVGTPEPGGPGWEEVWSLLAAVTRSRQIVGFDIVELAPNGAIGDTCAYTLSKLVYRFIGSIQRNQRQQEASRHG